MTKEELMQEHNFVQRGLSIGKAQSHAELTIEYAKPYMEIADLISRIFHYGNFKAETTNERLLERKLIEVGLWPTTEDEIINRPVLNS